MSPTVLPRRRRQQGVGGRHVLMVVLGFFGVVFVVNGVMIYSALSTHTGLVANEPYRKGLHYNERIEADERQARLGWSDSIEIGRDGRVTLLVAAPRRPSRHAASRSKPSWAVPRPTATTSSSSSRSRRPAATRRRPRRSARAAG